jgi:hypothetical protein
MSAAQRAMAVAMIYPEPVANWVNQSAAVMAGLGHRFPAFRVPTRQG